MLFTMMNRKVLALLINSVMESPHCALKSAIYRHCNAALQISTVYQRMNCIDCLGKSL